MHGGTRSASSSRRWPISARVERRQRELAERLDDLYDNPPPWLQKRRKRKKRRRRRRTRRTNIILRALGIWHPPVRDADFMPIYLRAPCILQSLVRCLPRLRSTRTLVCCGRRLQVLFAHSAVVARQWLQAHASVNGACWIPRIFYVKVFSDRCSHLEIGQYFNMLLVSGSHLFDVFVA